MESIMKMNKKHVLLIPAFMVLSLSASQSPSGNNKKAVAVQQPPSLTPYGGNVPTVSVKYVSPKSTPKFKDPRQNAAQNTTPNSLQRQYVVAQAQYDAEMLAYFNYLTALIRDGNIQKLEEKLFNSSEKCKKFAFYIDAKGNTLLKIAIFYNRFAIIQKLLKMCGAEIVDQQTAENVTPLLQAILTNLPYLVTYLLRYVKNFDGAYYIQQANDLRSQFLNGQNLYFRHLQENFSSDDILSNSTAIIMKLMQRKEHSEKCQRELAELIAFVHEPISGMPQQNTAAQHHASSAAASAYSDQMVAPVHAPISGISQQRISPHSHATSAAVSASPCTIITYDQPVSSHPASHIQLMQKPQLIKHRPQPATTAMPQMQSQENTAANPIIISSISLKNLPQHKEKVEQPAASAPINQTIHLWKPQRAIAFSEEDWNWFNEELVVTPAEIERIKDNFSKAKFRYIQQMQKLQPTQQPSTAAQPAVQTAPANTITHEFRDALDSVSIDDIYQQYNQQFTQNQTDLLDGKHNG